MAASAGPPRPQDIGPAACDIPHTRRSRDRRNRRRSTARVAPVLAKNRNGPLVAGVLLHHEFLLVDVIGEVVSELRLPQRIVLHGGSEDFVYHLIERPVDAELFAKP